MKTVPNKIFYLLIFSLFFKLGFSQEKPSYLDFVEIAKLHFNEKLIDDTIRKKYKIYDDNIFIELLPNAIFIDNILSDTLNIKLKLNDDKLYDKLFNNSELANYKLQSEKEINYNACDFESDSIFIYNEKRDKFINQDGKIRRMSDGFIYKMTKPFFTRNKKYAIINTTSLQTGSYVVFKRRNDKWNHFKDFYFTLK